VRSGPSETTTGSPPTEKAATTPSSAVDGQNPWLYGDNNGEGDGGNDDISGLNGPDFIDRGPGDDDWCDGGLGKDDAARCETQIDIP